MNSFSFEWVRGEHVRVYLDGVFLFTADSIKEAEEELKADGFEI